MNPSKTLFMKDFYYILGLPQTATADDIKKAYRKLSQKFHPDKNDGDAFFAERFHEVNEAYNTLIEPNKRIIYDAERNKVSHSASSTKTASFAPVIEFFRTDKNAFAFGETVTFQWKTSHANKVFIKPFGQVPATGEKTYRLKDFKNPALQFELVAERTGNPKQAKSVIVLRNNTYHELYQFFRQKIAEEGRIPTRDFRRTSHASASRRIQTQRGRNEQMYSAARPVLIIVALVIVLLLVLFFAVLE